MNARLSRAILVAAIVGAGFGFTGCSDRGVAGSTYGDSDNSISIEFRYDGKATYAEKGKNITVSCDGAAQPFTMNSDGSLTATNSGLFGKLTRKK
jgi:hypothetical protein